MLCDSSSLETLGGNGTAAGVAGGIISAGVAIGDETAEGVWHWLVTA